MGSARQEFRHGWKTIVAAATGVCFGTTGVPFYAMGLFIKPLTAEFGWSRAAVSGASFCLSAGIVLSAPLVGSLIDKTDLRRVGLVSLAGLALGFGLFALLGPYLLLLYAAWLGLSLAGCGTTPVVWTRAVNERFVQARGLALGLTLLGTGVAGILAPAVLGPIIATHGWRAGSLTIAAAIALIAVPIVFGFLRPYGAARADAVAATGMTCAVAVRTRHFIQMALAFLCLGIGIAGLIVHLVPLLTDHGLTAVQAAQAAATLGFAVIAGRLVVGALVDRFHAPYIGFVFLMLPAASAALLLANAPPILAVLLLGLAAGAEIDLLAYLSSRMFGMRAYGAVYGRLLSIFSLGAGIGPVLAGAAFDRMGNYDDALTGVVVLVMLGAGLVATLGRFPDWSGA